jgi:hypothetical protein
VPWNTLWNQGVFAPRLWAEVPARANARPFAREAMLADRLLPLPIDHRYGADDIARLASAVSKVMAW